MRLPARGQDAKRRILHVRDGPEMREMRNVCAWFVK